MTIENKWNNETKKYDMDENPYQLRRCGEILSDREAQTYLDISDEMLERSGVIDFTCPVHLQDKFVDGQEYGEYYTYTQIVLKLCDKSRGDKNCKYDDLEEARIAV